MQLRNRRGGITPAEGCMFGAVLLFVLLLLAILYIAFMRFRNPPPPTPTPAPVAAVAAPALHHARVVVVLAHPSGAPGHASIRPSPRADV